MTYPRHKLKTVEDPTEKDYETYEIDKIVDFKKVNDQLIYLVKWKNSDETDWVPVDHFNTMEVINEFHANLNNPNNKGYSLRRNKANQRVQPNVVKAKQRTLSGRKPGRPPKVKVNSIYNLCSIILTLLILTFKLTLVSCLNIEKVNLKYCNSHTEPRVLDVNNLCKLYKNDNMYYQGFFNLWYEHNTDLKIKSELIPASIRVFTSYSGLTTPVTEVTTEKEEMIMNKNATTLNTRTTRTRKDLNKKRSIIKNSEMSKLEIFNKFHKLYFGDRTNKKIFGIPRTRNISKYMIFDKVKHQVSGPATECSQETTTWTTEMSFFGLKSKMVSTKINTLNRAECDIMRKTMVCDGKPMSCADGKCVSNNKPDEDYTWLYTMTFSAINCLVVDRYITADNENDVVFRNSKCLAKHGECSLAKSIIIWDHKAIHSCPFTKVTEMQALQRDDEILFSPSSRLAFKIIDYDKYEICNDIIFYSTTEGLYITQDVKSNDLPKIEHSVDISKLLLAEADIDKYEEMELSRAIDYDICVSAVNSLKIYSNFDDKYIKLKDFKFNDYIIHASHGNLLIPQCIGIDKITVKNITENDCFEDLKVNFMNKNKTYIGFVNTDGIIVDNSRKIDCKNIIQVYDLGLDKKFLLRNNLETKLEEKVVIKQETISLTSINNSKINLNHINLLSNGTDLLSEVLSITAIQDTEFLLETFEEPITNKNKKFSYADYMKNITSVKDNLYFIVTVISISTIVITVIVYKLWRLIIKGLRATKNKAIRKLHKQFKKENSNNSNSNAQVISTNNTNDIELNRFHYDPLIQKFLKK